MLDLPDENYKTADINMFKILYIYIYIYIN